ncbi:unnamed protein product [Linum trigynum]|uniref:Uncharacterized protein n=1 Tax=Linum trigynum TaxID=586398 RepID=A0AAV2FW05_9ROSI
MYRRRRKESSFKSRDGPRSIFPLFDLLSFVETTRMMKRPGFLLRRRWLRAASCRRRQADDNTGKKLDLRRPP